MLNALQHSTSQKSWEPYICRENQTNRLEKLIVEFPHTALHLKWVQTNRSDKLGYLKKKWAMQTREKYICFGDILITYTFIKQNTSVDLMLQWSWRDLSIRFKFCKCLKVLPSKDSSPQSAWAESILKCFAESDPWCHKDSKWAQRFQPRWRIKPNSATGNSQDFPESSA